MKFVSQEKEYIYQICQGLSIFGRMEMALSLVFAIAARTADEKAADRIFWSVNSLEVRTAMTAAALKTVFPLLAGDSEVPALWTEIATAIPKMAKKRAALAHGNWLGVAWIRKEGTQHQDQFFAPYYGKASVDIDMDSRAPAIDPRPKKRLYLPDLEARKTEFSILEMRVRHLSNRLSYELQAALAQRAQKRPRQSRRVRPSANRTK
jgi:hypothetical protein